MMRGALAITSLGNSTLSIEPDVAPRASASRSTERLMPTRPPTPISVKPKPSWIPGLNSTLMIATNANPLPTSGSLVEMTPIAVTLTSSRIDSSSTPAYSPRSTSIER